MAKIVDEPVLLRHDTIEGKQVPVYSAKVETTITNTKTGHEYSSHEEVEADIANPATETKEEDIRRDVHVIAPNLFGGAATGE
jgi:hypothetical protein|tara:strand:- start:207 stop:455 length:249 start_codon:yes stop_codon:yes gene_type:complete